MAIVQTNTNYTSSILYSNIASLKKAFPFIQIGSIGKSVLGESIPYIKVGRRKYRSILFS